MLVPQLHRGNIDADAVNAVALLIQRLHGLADLMQDNFGQHVDKPVLFRQRDKAVRINEAFLRQVQPHQRLRGIVLPGADIQHRLAVNQHPRIIQVLLPGNIRQLMQDRFILPEFVDVVRLHPVDRVFRNPGMDAPDKADIFVVPVQFRCRLADHNFVIQLEVLIFLVERPQDRFGPRLIVRVPLLPDHHQQVAVSDPEHNGRAEILRRKTADDRLQVAGHLACGLIQLPHVEAQVQICLAFIVAVADQAFQSAQVIGSQLRVIGIGMQQVHNGNHREEEGGGRKRILSVQLGNGEHRHGEDHGHVETVHHPTVQMVAHLDHQHGQHHDEQPVSDHEYPVPAGGSRAVSQLYPAAGEIDKELRSQHHKDQHPADGMVYLPFLLRQAGDLADVGSELIQHEQQQPVIQALEPVEQSGRQVWPVFQQGMEGYVGCRRGHQDADQGKEHPERPGAHLEGEEQQNQHNGTDPQNHQVACIHILLQLKRLWHSPSPFRVYYSVVVL
uniref:Uncharacterized protein n=1 Tax=uncultured bacterium Contig1767 TaxID=1393509 RepID=W0FLY6_9BACT|nr:hypothetical protein [uncultured bacterium Contig1767]